MADTDSGKTHPVYIALDRKTRVKTLAVQEETTMKEVTERLAEHGDRLDLYKIPLDASDQELLDHVRKQL